MLTVTGLQKYYDYLACQNDAALTREKMESGKPNWGKKEDTLSAGNVDFPLSSKKKKRGKGLLRLMEAYSKHVEGLQMIQ